MISVSDKRFMAGGAGHCDPDRRHTPARVSELMLPARGRVARFVTPRVESAVHGSVAVGLAERALRATSGLPTMADDVTAHPQAAEAGL
jgi:hypothetical protein